MKNIITLFLLFYSFILCSQENPYELPQVVPPSPTVANLMQFEEVPVNNYTGQPDISIPLFSKSIHNALAINLALHYNTHGVKIDNRSGWTGTGWSLSAGGTVSRTVRGLPDEMNESNRTGIYHNSDFWNYEDLTFDQQAEFTWNAVGTSYDYYDIEYDLYQFSFLGVSGRFIITKEGPHLLSNESNIKIEIDQDVISGVINNFILIDGRGYRYHFDVIEELQIEPFSGIVPQDGEGILDPSSYRNAYNSRSAWHLSEIRTSNDKLLVSFDYQDSYEEYVTSYNKTYYQISKPGQYFLKENAYNRSIMKPEYAFTSNTIKTTTKKLSRIDFLGQTSIDIIKGGSHPETNGQVLQHIVINNKDDSENKRYSFVYEHTDRLWLTKVIETPITGTPITHTLSYFEKENLAAFNENSDAWGYNYKLPYSENTIKAGLLTHIETPTGGIKEFIWEEHTYGYRSSYKLQEADYIENPMNTNKEVFRSQFTALSPFVTTTPAPLATLTIDNPHKIRIGISEISGFQHEEDYIKIFLSKTNVPEEGVHLPLKNAFDYLEIEETGTYNIFAQYMGYNINPDFTEVDGLLQITYRKKIDGPLFEFLLGGGLRIKEVLFRDSIDSTEVKRRLSYSYLKKENNKVSSGSADVNIQGNLNNHRIDVACFLFTTPLNSGGTFKTKSVTYDVKTKTARSQLTKGGYVGYKYVKVSEENKGYIGYTYTNPIDYPTSNTVFHWPFYPATNIDYKRGVLLKEEFFDDSNKIQKENLRSYDFVTRKIANLYKAIDLMECNLRQFYDTYAWNLTGTVPEINDPDCGGGRCLDLLPPGCGKMANLMIIRNIDFGWAQLKESITKDYFYDDFGAASVVETKMNYEYNTENYLPKIITRTITEGGRTNTYTEERFYPVGGYPTAVFSSGEQTSIDRLKTLHKVTTPVYIENHKNDTLIGSVQYIYDEFLPDVVLAKDIKSGKGSDTPEVRLTYHAYDAYGNPLEVSQEDGARDHLYLGVRLYTAYCQDYPCQLYRDAYRDNHYY